MVVASSAACPLARSANPVAAEVEVHDGMRAIEVQAMYRGVVVNTRHLYDPNVKATSNQATGMLILGGAAALVIAHGGVPGHRVRRGQGEGRLRGAPRTPARRPRPSSGSRAPPAPDAIVFLGLGVGLALVYMGLKRRGAKEHDYVIGADPNADAPVPG